MSELPKSANSTYAVASKMRQLETIILSKLNTGIINTTIIHNLQ